MTDRPAPYPADTRAKGWRFELNMEQVKKSDTWLRARTGRVRASLLLLWAEAWEQTPCGSLPNDDELLCLLLDMEPAEFAAARPVLMRGWWEAEDGRLYHDTITARVLDMLKARAGNAKRVADHKAKQREERAGNALPPQQQQDGSHGSYDTGTRTGTREETPSLLPQAPAFPPESRPAEPPQLALVDAAKPRARTVPDCPHQSVLALWAEVLPAMPQHNPGMWAGTRADHLRARWRETAVAEKWETEADGIAYLRRLFVYIGRSAFLTGRGKGGGDRPPFVAELAWVVNPQNWAKVHEGKYHTDAA